MVAIYIAGFVIFFAVANVAYKASLYSRDEEQNRVSAPKSADASPVEVIQIGSLNRLLRQRSAAGQLGSASATVGVKGSPSQNAIGNA